MTITTGLSGNEIFCLAQKNYKPGNIVIGNSVHAIGLFGTIGSGINAILGGEINQVTSLIMEGREAAYKRLVKEAVAHKACGVTGVTSELVFHGGNIEFLSIGSAIHTDNANDKTEFTTAADGQELYAQIDAGYKPICFSFGNVAYSIGLGRGALGALKQLARGEIREYSDMFNHTRHLALERIVNNAKQHNANAVLGIKTTILAFGGISEMLMIGTASKNEKLTTDFPDQIVTSDMTNIEMWNMTHMGYAPVKLLLGTSVYSLGLVGNITAILKSFVRGEINELTRMIYDARENAISIIESEAKSIGADDVVGVKTYVYQLGNGLIEFLAIGTAVKRLSSVKTESAQLIPQAIVIDQKTFFEANSGFGLLNANSGNKPINPISSLFILIIFILIFLFIKYTH